MKAIDFLLASIIVKVIRSFYKPENLDLACNEAPNIIKRVQAIRAAIHDVAHKLEDGDDREILFDCAGLCASKSISDAWRGIPDSIASIVAGDDSLMESFSLTLAETIVQRGIASYEKRKNATPNPENYELAQVW